MDSEEHIIISFIFKRSGKQELKPSEIYLPLSLELGWFSSQQAQQFVQVAQQQKLLVHKKNLLAPSFDINTITIPVGFRPSKQTCELIESEKQKTKKPETLLEGIVDRISQLTKQESAVILAEIKQLQEEKTITPEVAALLLALKRGLTVQDFYEPVENTFVKEKT